MFSKISRYKKSDEIISICPRGRNLRSTDLRMLPETTGTFEHFLQEGDRLDQLSYKYYHQPRTWWRICDANPDIPDPLALIGTDVIVEMLFLLTLPEGEKPPWFQLQGKLHETVGVESVLIIENISLTEEDHDFSGENVPYFLEDTQMSLIVAFNSLNTSKEDLTTLINTTLFEVSGTQKIGRVGKKIIIPPKRSA